MIHPNYAKALLNALFQTDGEAGITRSEERANLIAQGVDQSVFTTGVTATMYLSAFIADGYETDGENTKRLDEQKKHINASSWYNTQNTEAEIKKYKQDGVEKSKSFTGWKVVTLTQQRNDYPDNAYLALFTTMPDGNGSGYVEPIMGADGAATSYIRVNLFEAVVTGNVCINSAVTSTVIDAETGEESAVALLNNCEAIMYPEVVDVDWGSIVGFGVFEKEETGTGDKPIFWGKLNDPISATVGHVPLFRAGDFEVTLQ